MLSSLGIVVAEALLQALLDGFHGSLESLRRRTCTHNCVKVFPREFRDPGTLVGHDGGDHHVIDVALGTSFKFKVLWIQIRIRRNGREQVRGKFVVNNYEWRQRNLEREFQGVQVSSFVL